jgi:HEAT repeat protein
MAVRTQALASLQSIVVETGSPGREADRKAMSLALCTALEKDPPVLAAMDLLRQLVHIGDDECVGTLEVLIAHPDEHLRENARRALEVNPSPRAGRVLQDRLGKADSLREVAGILQSLGQRGQADAVPAIAAQLDAENPTVSRAATAALVALGGRTACHALAKARRTVATDRREAISTALLDAAYTSFLKGDADTATSVYKALTKPSEPESVRAHAFRGLALTQPDKAAEVVVLVMSQPSEACQVAVIEAADALRNQAEPISSLVRKLDAMDPALQTLTLQAVHGNLAPGLENEIHGKLLSGPVKVSAAAADAIQRLGRSTSVGPLLEAMAAKGPRATAAASALERMTAPGVDEALLAQAAGGDPGTRVLAITVLEGRNATSALPQLITLLSDPDASVSKAAANALRTLASPADLAMLATALRDPMPESAAKAVLGAVIAAVRKSDDPAEAAPPLVEALVGADAAARASLLQALGEVGGPLALEAEVAALADKDEGVRQRAIKVLARWKGQEAVPHLLAIAGDETVPLADHVAALQGALRLARESKNRNLTAKWSSEVLSVARRPEEKQAAEELLRASTDADTP